ncbi:MarR family transcriptional regulator [Nocardioides salsibiostraticola]
MTATVEASDPTLDQQLCFALYSASRAMTGAYRTGLAGLGLTYPQYVVLLVLWEVDAVSMGELSRRLHLDSATLSPLLKRLEQRGLITRHRSPTDERTVELACTPQGHALEASVRAVQREAQSATGLTSTELADLRDDLHRVAGRLREHEPSDLPGSL